MPALIRKVHEAKLRGDPSITLWGTGKPLREFLHVDDCADACVHLVTDYSDMEHVNVGSGEDLSIQELARLVCRVAGYGGEIVHDLSKPDGAPRKLMSVEKIISLGWKPRIALKDGVESVYRWYVERTGEADRQH